MGRNPLLVVVCVASLVASGPLSTAIGADRDLLADPTVRRVVEQLERSSFVPREPIFAKTDTGDGTVSSYRLGPRPVDRSDTRRPLALLVYEEDAAVDAVAVLSAVETPSGQTIVLEVTPAGVPDVAMRFELDALADDEGNRTARVTLLDRVDGSERELGTVTASADGQNYIASPTGGCFADCLREHFSQLSIWRFAGLICCLGTAGLLVATGAAAAAVGPALKVCLNVVSAGYLVAQIADAVRCIVRCA